jgi:hypothetical protein
MTDDLVKRLRNPVAAMRPTITDGRLAAERIEALTADNARLCEKLSEAAEALDDACDKLSEFANCLSREPWEALSARHSAREARAALNTGKEPSHE